MTQEQRQPIVETTERSQDSNPMVQVKPLIAESSLQQLVQLYKKPQPQNGEPMNVASSNSMDSVIQFQDRQRVYLKRPSQEKLGNLAHLKHHEKKKITDDLMNVDLE